MGGVRWSLFCGRENGWRFHSDPTHGVFAKGRQPMNTQEMNLANESEARTVDIFHGNCLSHMLFMDDNSVDSIVTDPPYGLSFMGKRWDYDVPSVEIWAECLRVLKPGGHLLAFAGTRTQHRMAVRIEDAGFEIRDMIAWVYGSGFPKSLDVSKAIDKAAGAARQWQGWGTALKPALEPITVARKPLVGTVAANVLEHGTGGLNIEACRVPTDENLNGGAYAQNATEREQLWGAEANNSWVRGGAGDFVAPTGRWPANLIHDGSDEVMAAFPTSASPWIGNNNTGKKGGLMFGGTAQAVDEKPEYRDAGSAARFFYCAKTSKKERDLGLDVQPDRILAMSNQAIAELKRGNMHQGESGVNTAKVRKNNHPTVKPLDLMAYLCRLVTPPGGLVYDPFMGSGSTGIAALREGFCFAGSEMQADYVAIARARIAAALLGGCA